MWAAVTVGVISLIAAVMMIRAAVGEGFAVLQVPIAILELMFLGAVFLIWRGLRGSQDDDLTERRPAARVREVAAPEAQPSRPSGPRAVSEDPRSRLSALADWWFNGLRDSGRP